MWPTDLEIRRVSTLAIAATSVALLGLIFLAHLQSPLSESHLSDYFSNSLHAPGFAFVSVAVLAIMRVFRRTLTIYLYAGVSAMAIGVLSEAVQIPGPRDASISDLTADLLGIVAGLGTLALFDRVVRARMRKWQLAGLGATTTLAVAMAFLPTLLFAYAATSQWRAMPAILTFEEAWERAVYRKSLPGRPRLILAPSGWLSSYGTIAYAKESGQSRILIRIEPSADWSGYSELNFMAAASSEATHIVKVVVRELPDDSGQAGAMYSTEIAINHEPKQYRILLDEIQRLADRDTFDLARVSSVTLYATSKTPDVAVLLDDFRLR